MLRLTSFVLIFALSASAREVQSHGFVFEKWLRDTFFGGFIPSSYTQRWDIPAEANTNHGGIPVNPKAIKYGTPLDFGDAIRQFEITEKGESFLLIVGFWEQTTPTSKTWVNAQTVKISPTKWAQLWHPVSRADLEKLDRVIKDKSLSLEAARAYPLIPAPSVQSLTGARSTSAPRLFGRALGGSWLARRPRLWG